MAEGKCKRKPQTIRSAEKKTPESRFSVLKRFIVAGGAAGLMATAAVWSWQHYYGEKLTGTDIFVPEIRCNDRNVVVRSSDPKDVLNACEGAQDAIAFLASQGLDVTGDITIEVVTRLPPLVSRSAAGCYLESERRVLILAYSEFKKFKTWFGIPIDRSLYRSLVSHEVSHLVADDNFNISEPTIQAKEYLAYVAQFSAMEPVLRERVLSQFPCEAFEGDWQMATTIYMFDCMRFGVRAYRHFLRLDNGRDYLQAILNGKALIE